MNDDLKIAFLGDIALNDNYINHYLMGNDPFEKISDTLQKTDFVVGNLEVTCRGVNGVNTLKNPTLYTNEETLNYLNNLNVGLVSLANNHVYDNLKDGFQKTVNFLSQKKIRFTGARIKNNNPFGNLWEIIEIKGKKIAFLSYVHPDTNPSLPANCDIDVNIYEVNKIVNHINSLSGKVDHIILLLHWGLDNSSFPAPWQRKDASKFIEAGADLIIGHHAHVIQGCEIINGKYVYYGLGNFCFSPFISDGKLYELDQRRHTSAIIVKISFEQKQKHEIIPVVNSNDEIIFSKETGNNKFKLYSKLIPAISNRSIWPIYSFYLKFIYKSYFYFLGNSRSPFLQLKKLKFGKIKAYIKKK